MKRIIITALFICSMAVCFAAATGIAGVWSGVLKTEDGSEFPLTYTFKVDGDKLTGNVSNPSVGELPIFDGKVKGDSIFFKVNHNGNDIPNIGRCYADSVGINIKLETGTFHVRLKHAAK